MLRRALQLSHMLRAERRELEGLRVDQNKALRELVRHAGLKVPFYRELYARHGVDLDAFRGLEDLTRLPIVDKRSLRAAGAQVLAEDHPPQLVPILTSGSTGEPYQFCIDRHHDQWRKAQYLRPYLSNGRRLHHKVLRLTAFPSTRRPWFSALGILREWQLDCAAEPQRVLARWRELRPSVLQGYPSSLLTLAQYCLEQGVRLDPAPRRVFTDSEMLRPDVRVVLERAFGTAPIDIFGTYETDNIAYQCAEHGGYHVALDSVVLEIVRDGQAVPAGEEGELVATVLTNTTHPFIRYRLGDIGRFATTNCGCGRTFPLLEVINGRTDDMIKLADGTLCSPMSVLGLLDGFALQVRHYQLQQLTVDRFELWIVPAPDYTPEVADHIVRTLKEPLRHATIMLRLVDTAPRDPSGKLRAFICAMEARTRA